MMPVEPVVGEAALRALMPRLRRYRFGAIHVHHTDTPALLRALRTVLPSLVEVDLLEGRSGTEIEALLAHDVVTWSEEASVTVPAVLTGSEALWTALATRKQEDAWRALTLSETPLAPRLLLLHSPHFLDRYREALAGAPEPQRFVRWTS